MNSAYKILLIDDHPMIIDSYKTTIARWSPSEIDVSFSIYSVTSVREAIEFVDNPRNQDIDLILLNISMTECPEKKNTLAMTSGNTLNQLIQKSKSVR